jgi:hypothetical protein
MAIDTNGRPISSVLRDIVQNIQDIVQAELRLAKTEIGETIVKAKSAGTLLGVGAACGFFAILFVLQAVVFALSNVVPNWAAALVVGAAMGIGAALLVSVGRSRLRRVRPIPEHTIDTIKENFSWTKQPTK